MPKYTERFVGKAKFVSFPDSKSGAYSDGEVENQLLKLFSQSESESLRRKILSNQPTWPETYHLSYGRENLLNWLNFKEHGSVLEFGGGCGALTGVLTDKFTEVVSVELSERRALIMANRHKDSENLNVIATNIMNYKPAYKFDAITAIGTLEYSPSYIEGSNPVDTLLRKLKSMLKPGGVLVVAIENKLGLKYWSGAAEDHTGKIYEGIYGYPEFHEKVVTFSKTELEKILLEAGFGSCYFYYPYPDYKLPYLIYSDDFYPGKDGSRFPLSILPAPNTDREREILMSEAHVMKSLEDAGLFREFSNSFLVVASA